MRNIEESMKSALFRAKMMEKHTYDPGPNWDSEDLFTKIVIAVTVALILSYLVSS